MDLKVGDLCWAKMKGFPPWPGKIIAPPQSEKYRSLHRKLHHYVYFFGSGNYAWVPAANIKSNSEEAIKQASEKKSKPLQKAIQQLKRNMPRDFVSQDIEEKYCQEGIIKPFFIGIERLRIDASQVKESNSFTLNELSSLGVYDDEIPQPSMKIRKTDIFWNLNEDNMKADTCSRLTESQEMAVKKFGFIGVGEIGKGFFMNLLKSKCDIKVWNQTSEVYDLSHEQQTIDSFPSLIEVCDIILCCISSEEKVQSLFQGDMGILKSFVNCENKGKGLVLLANVDLQVCAEIASSIQDYGGRYITAPLLGSETQAINGELLIVCSGDESLFVDCDAAFRSFKNVAYLGPDIELAPKIHTIIALFLNSVSKSYNEAKSLIQELKLPVQSFDDLFKTIFGEDSLAALCHDPFEKRFTQEDRIRFFLENLNLKTLLEANFPSSSVESQRSVSEELV